METVLNILIAAAVAVGLAFDTLGVVGILRFPDVYTRLHADTKATTFGTLFLTLGAALWAVKGWVAGGWDGGMLQQALHTGIVAVVLAVTNATGSHAIARAAWHAGVKPAGTVCNALEARKAEPEAAAEEAAAVEAPDAEPSDVAEAAPAEAAPEAEAVALPEPVGAAEAEVVEAVAEAAGTPAEGAREEEAQG